MRCNGVGLARFHEWNVKRPDPLIAAVRRLNPYPMEGTLLLRCTECGHETGTPVAIGGCAVFGLSSALTGLIIGIAAINTLWWILFAPVLWLAISYLIWNLPLWIPQFIARLRRCEKCGKRSWRSARYGGFGL